jgi:hypothetical protein
METVRFASTFDFEEFAKKKLDKPTYEHLLGQPRPANH